MKAVLVSFLLLATSRLAADPDFLSPTDVLKADGTLGLTDGSSFFVFSQDGAFHSFPVGLSGRCLDGRWTATYYDPTAFTVEAKLSWINGASPENEYRRIVFVVYRGGKQPNARPTSGVGKPPKEVWNGYFLIDELTKIPKPVSADDAKTMPDLQSLVGKAIVITLKPQIAFIESGPPTPPGMVTFRGMREIYTGILVRFDDRVIALSPLPTSPKTATSPYGDIPYVSQIDFPRDGRIESVEAAPTQ